MWGVCMALWTYCDRLRFEIHGCVYSVFVTNLAVLIYLSRQEALSTIQLSGESVDSIIVVHQTTPIIYLAPLLHRTVQ